MNETNTATPLIYPEDSSYMVVVTTMAVIPGVKYNLKEKESVQSSNQGAALPDVVWNGMVVITVVMRVCLLVGVELKGLGGGRGGGGFT